MQKEITAIDTGMVKTGNAGSQLIVNAIGSCVAIIAYDATAKIGGIAHVMLPGRAPADSETIKTRYTCNAFEELLFLLKKNGADIHHLDFCIAGGGNVLQRIGDTICISNITAVTACIHDAGYTIAAQSIGGTDRRKIRFDIERGIVFCTVGDNPESILYHYGKENPDGILFTDDKLT